MCGIAGIARWHPGPDLTVDVERMTSAIAHRGPDDSGVVNSGDAWLGHRRLSILDLTAAGHQPMVSADGRVWLTFNGEIYNFQALRDELEGCGYHFRSRSDTEVLLAGFVEWGAAVFGRLNGIWAVAIWDSRKRELTLSRDRFGVKPLFVAKGPGIIAFASEIKSLLLLPWVDGTPDDASVNDFLHASAVDRTQRTFFTGIRRVPAATVETIGSHGERSERYWSPTCLSNDTSYGRKPGDDELVVRFRESFVAAVERQLQSDVPIGSCLSGGLDSSSIVSVAAVLRAREIGGSGTDALDRIVYPQLGFFARFTEPRLDEYRYARAVADATGADLRIVVPTADTFLGALMPTVIAQDEPFAGTSVVAQHMVMSLANAGGVRVLLDGQGADELFGGQRAYIGPRLVGAGVARNPVMGLRSLQAVTRGEIPLDGIWSRAKRRARRAVGRPPQPSALMGYAGPRADILPAPRAEYADIEGSPLSRALWKNIVFDTLPALLRYEDRNSMAFSIEARVPFLDHDLVDLLLSFPDRLKLDPGATKRVLRESMRGIVVDTVLDRRDKVGYEPPQARWLRAGLDRLRPLAQSPLCEEMGFIRPKGFGDILDAFESSRVSHDAAWRGINVELWLRNLHGEDIDSLSDSRANTQRP